MPLQTQRASATPVHRLKTPNATTASHAAACRHDGLKSSSNKAAANRQNTTGLPMAMTRRGNSQ